MKKYIIIIFMIICGLQQAVSGAVLYDPDLEWKSIKAEHFWIHYHQGLDSVAAKMSVIAEKVHKKLVPMIKWAPALRTDIVLIDNMYTANGFTTPIPYNKIQIFITRPEPDSILGNFDDWLEFAFTHEYTHLLNLDTATGFPGGIRRTFGRCCFPNVFVPVWMTEGTAVYHESLDTVFGRNNSTYTDMIFRTELQKNRFKSIAEASTYPRRWPNGNVPYLYGGLFIDYLEKKYGKGTMSNIFIENSDNLIPFEDFCIILPFPCMENRKCDRAVLNDSFVDVWDEWEEFLKIKYTRQIENIKKEEVTKFTKITGSGFNTANPRFSRDGNSVFYTRLTNYNKPALMRYYIPLNETDVLCRVNDPGSISVTDNGMLYISDAEFYKSFSIYNDAYIYDGEYRKLTSKLRSGYIDITPDGKNAVFIKNIGGRYSMILTDKLFMEYRNLIADSDIQLSFTKFSPEGNRIVFSLKDKKGNTDIAILDILKNEIKRLTDDSFNDIEPAWHPDGKHIIFTSDRNGVYNLHEYELTKNTISRITNIIGGAFSPDISPDGKTIAFASYGRDGFDIALLKYPEKKYTPEKINPAVLPVEYFYPEKNKPEETAALQPEDYTIWNSIAPPFWVPLIFQASDDPFEGNNQWTIGFASPLFLPANDTLLRHSYLFQCLNYLYEKRSLVAADYAYTRFYPNFIFSYYNDTLMWGKDEFPWKDSNKKNVKRETEKSGIAGISVPFYYFQSMHTLSFSYQYSESRTDYYNADLDITGKYKDTEAMIRMRYEYNCASLYTYSISPEDGRSFYLVSEVYDKKLGSDLSYTLVYGEYAEYLPGMWKNNVTMLRLRGGAAFNNPAYKAPFNLGRFEKGKTGSEKAEEESFGLRGYPSGLVYGNTFTTASAEYRFPVLQMDLGYDTIPLMFRDLWINIFTEAGNVREDHLSYGEVKKDLKKTSYTELRKSKISICDFKSSAGIELNMRITLGYSAGLDGRIGYAKGFNKYGEDQVYFAVSTAFEGAFKEQYKWLDYL